jgi:hypothetical protein
MHYLFGLLVHNPSQNRTQPMAPPTDWNLFAELLGTDSGDERRRQQTNDSHVKHDFNGGRYFPSLPQCNELA